MGVMSKLGHSRWCWGYIYLQINLYISRSNLVRRQGVRVCVCVKRVLLLLLLPDQPKCREKEKYHYYQQKLWKPLLLSYTEKNKKKNIQGQRAGAIWWLWRHIHINITIIGQWVWSVYEMCVYVHVRFDVDDIICSWWWLNSDSVGLVMEVPTLPHYGMQHQQH